MAIAENDLGRSGEIGHTPADLGRGQTYHITEQEIATSSGILRKYHHTLRLKEIRSISYQRTVVQQIFNCGDILISTSATANFTTRLKNIDHVQTVCQQINDHR